MCIYIINFCWAWNTLCDVAYHLRPHFFFKLLFFFRERINRQRYRHVICGTQETFTHTKFNHTPLLSAIICQKLLFLCDIFQMFLFAPERISSNSGRCHQYNTFIVYPKCLDATEATTLAFSFASKHLR